jgi:hypothetical protein
MRLAFVALEEWSSAATRFRYPSGSGAAPTVSTSMLKDRQGRLVALHKLVTEYVSADDKGAHPDDG